MQVDEKALEAARQAYQASIPDGAWHADGGKTDTPMRAAIDTYLSALGEQKPGIAESVAMPIACMLSMKDAVITAAYDADEDAQLAFDALEGSPLPVRPITDEDVERRFKLGDRVTKTKGSSWTGHVVGFYSTTLTPIGYAVESENEPGNVQIYPEAALEAAGGRM